LRKCRSFTNIRIGATLNTIGIFHRPNEGLFPQTCEETVGPDIFNGEIDYHLKKPKPWKQVNSFKQFCPSTISVPSQGEQGVLFFQEDKVLDSTVRGVLMVDMYYQYLKFEMTDVK
jgi:hypothetical protein